MIGRVVVAVLLLAAAAPGEARAQTPGGIERAAFLHARGYRHAAAAQLATMAERADAPPELLRWLARLAFELPEAAQGVERIERYAAVGRRGDVLDLLETLDAPVLRRELAFRLGRYLHESGRAAEALRALAVV